MNIPCNPSLLTLIQDNIAVEYIEGGVAILTGAYTTGWRQLPCHVVAQVLNGRTTLRLQERKDQTIDHREAVLVRKGVAHCFEKTQKGRSISRWACFRVRLFGGFDALDLMELPFIYRPRVSDKIGDICENIARFRQSRESFDLREMANMKSWCFQLVALLVENAAFRPNAAQIIDACQRLTRVYQAIHERPEHHFSLDELAKLACLSASRFHALFTRQTGIPPLKYIQNLRMDRARILLLSTDLNIGEIGERIGLENQFYFSRLFKRASGLSPLQYRQQTRKGSWNAAGGG